jgi:hypothetical protein
MCVFLEKTGEISLDFWRNYSMLMVLEEKTFIYRKLSRRSHDEKGISIIDDSRSL